MKIIISLKEPDEVNYALNVTTKAEFDAIKYGLQELSQSGYDNALTRNAARMFKQINGIKILPKE